MTDAVSSIISIQLERKKKLARLLQELESLKYGSQGASGSIPAGNHSSANPAGSAANNNGINPVDSFTPSSAPTNETSGASDNSSSAINSDSNTSGSAGQAPPASQAPEVTAPQLQDTINQLRQMINNGNNVLQNSQSSTPDFNPTNDTNKADKDSLNRLTQNGRNISDSEANQQAADHQKWLADQVQKARSGPSPSDNNSPPDNNTNSMGEPLEQASEAAPETPEGPGGGTGPGGPGAGAPPGP